MSVIRRAISAYAADICSTVRFALRAAIGRASNACAVAIIASVRLALRLRIHSAFLGLISSFSCVKFY